MPVQTYTFISAFKIDFSPYTNLATALAEEINQLEADK